MITRAQKGFTLIELLVVIAIIGLLAAVVLAAVGTARSKGSDAAVKGQLNSARSQGELYASSNGSSYSGVCAAAANASPAGMGGASGPGILKNAASVTSATAQVDTAPNTGAGGSYNDATCNDNASAWAMQAPLTGSASGAGNAKFWCVDSNGAALQETTAFVAGVAGTGTFACPTT